MGVPIALRNLFEGKTRFIISVGGVALAILLILVFDGVFAGSMKQVTIYMDKTPFDIVVAQKGVKNLHMTTSFFPTSKVNEIKKVKGVENVSSILYSTDFIVSGNNRSIAYIIGYTPSQLGGPWKMVGGSTKLKKGEIIIDEQVAKKHGLKLGDEVTVLGRKFKIGGLTRDTVSIINSIAFIRFDDFEEIRNLKGVVSYTFVNVEKDEKPEVVLEKIREKVKGVTVQTREEFAESERKIISDMSVDIMKIMNFIGFLIALAALGLTVYTTTLSKIQEYGVLKALGAKNSKLFIIVFEQAAVSIAMGFVLALILVYILIGSLSLLDSNILIIVEVQSVLKVITASIVIGIFSSAIPIARIARLKPAEVFRH
jgi:putative ABC transport system permease protein